VDALKHRILAKGNNLGRGILKQGLYGLQFHREVVHTDRGRGILRRFAVEV
jgi:GMP synthase-like glutamine amidotransferase